MAPSMSIVVTVRNDRVGLGELLPALEAQTTAPGEILIVDGGSGDGTAELIDYWRGRGLPLRVIQAPGAGISAGRNRGIRAAANGCIAITDAGCRPAPGWLEAFASALEHNDFVAGVYTVDRDTKLEHAVSVTLYPDVEELSTQLDLGTRAWLRLFGRQFLVNRATGRSMAFRRTRWELAGGFPENVNWGEDVAFSAAAVDSGATATLAADAVVAWRGRTTLNDNARMYWRYAKGEAVLGPPPRAFARAFAWISAVVLLAAGGRRGRVAALLGASAYVSLPLRRARRSGLEMRHWWMIVTVLGVKDLAMLSGTASGLRLKSRGITTVGTRKPVEAAQPPKPPAASSSPS